MPSRADSPFGDSFGYPGVAMHVPVAPWTRGLHVTLPVSTQSSQRVEMRFNEATLVVGMDAYVRPSVFGDPLWAPREPTAEDVFVLADYNDKYLFTEVRSDTNPNGSVDPNVVLASLGSKARLWFARLETANPSIGFRFRWAYPAAPPAPLQVSMSLYTLPLRDWDELVKSFGPAAAAALAEAVRKGIPHV